MVALVPLVTVANTTTVPAAVVLRVLPVMLAPVVPLSCMLHTMFLLVALEGATVPESVSGVPTVASVGTFVISVTATNDGADALTLMVNSFV